jgi:dCMP deaminase
LGYNGTPVGTLNCYQGGCKRCYDQWFNNNVDSAAKSLDLCMCLHAEENAILFNKREDLENSTIYVTLIPCISCVKKIIQCKIARVVYIDDYNPDLDIQSKEILYQNNIELVKYIE